MDWSSALSIRKKIISTLIYFFLIFNLLPTWSPQNQCDHTPLTSPSDCASLMIPTPSCMHVFGWLLCKIVVRRPPISYFFVASFAAPNTSPPHAFRLSLVSSAMPPHRSPSLVSWCVYGQNGGHLRSRPRPSLNFLMGALLVLKTRERRAVRMRRAP